MNKHSVKHVILLALLAIAITIICEVLALLFIVPYCGFTAC